MRSIAKQRIDVNHKGQWGYHPLVVSLAHTGEPLFVVHRSGNRRSHEGAAAYLDRAAALCRRAGFHRITLRGDTDFTQTAQLDRWDADGIRFIFGIDVMPNLYDRVEELPEIPITLTGAQRFPRPGRAAREIRRRIRIAKK